MRPWPQAPLADPFGVTLYGSALKHWMARFRGVATRYLSSYVAWHLQTCRWDGLDDHDRTGLLLRLTGVRGWPVAAIT